MMLQIKISKTFYEDIHKILQDKFKCFRCFCHVNEVIDKKYMFTGLKRKAFIPHNLLMTIVLLAEIQS